MTTRNPTWVAEDYRFYADTGTAGSSALAAQNTAVTISDGTKFRLRVAVGETNNANTANVGSWVLQYSVNGGAFATVGAATSVKYVTSDAAAFVDGSSLTQALGGVTGSATYQSTWSEQDEGGSVGSQTWTDDDTEYEYCMQLNGVSVADTITFRMLSPSSSTAVTFTNVPTIRVPVVHSSLFTASPTFYSATANHQIPQAASFTSSTTFYGGTVTYDQTITQSASFTSSPAFYAGQVGQGAEITQGSLFTGSATFYGGTVTNNPQGRHFGPRYFGSRYFGRKYWGTIQPAAVDGAYFGQRYFGSSYFGRNYWANNARVETWNITVSAAVTMSAAVGVSAPSSLSFNSSFAVGQTNSIGLACFIATQGSLSFGDEFVFTPPLEVTQLNGALAVAGDITITDAPLSPNRYFGKRYFGNRYFGKRYWSVTGPAFELVQSAAVPMNGSLTTAGDIRIPVALSQTNVVGLSGSVTTASGGIEFGVATVHPEPNVGWAYILPPKRRERRKTEEVEKRDEMPVVAEAAKAAPKRISGTIRAAEVAQRAATKPRVTAEPLSIDKALDAIEERTRNEARDKRRNEAERRRRQREDDDLLLM